MEIGKKYRTEIIGGRSVTGVYVDDFLNTGNAILETEKLMVIVAKEECELVEDPQVPEP